jgi:hypothetical protein
VVRCSARIRFRVVVVGSVAARSSTSAGSCTAWVSVVSVRSSRVTPRRGPGSIATGMSGAIWGAVDPGACEMICEVISFVRGLIRRVRRAVLGSVRTAFSPNHGSTFRCLHQGPERIALTLLWAIFRERSSPGCWGSSACSGDRRPRTVFPPRIRCGISKSSPARSQRVRTTCRKGPGRVLEPDGGLGWFCL